MQDKQQLITLAFVLIIGLLGGYMLGQHEGDEHHEMHDREMHGGMDDQNDRMMPQGDMPASTTGAVDVHVE